jgi:superfamily I DNA/RNA helicase
MTFHSLALRNLTRRCGKLKVDTYKYNRLAEKQFGLDCEAANAVSQIVSDFQLKIEPIFVDPKEWTQAFAFGLMSEQTMFDLDLAQPDLLVAIDQAMQLLRAEAVKLTGLSFDDMLFFLAYLAKKKRWNLQDYSCVVVDEAQDVSPIRMHILSLLSKRLIQVGDRRQAIYAFAGAMTNAMDQMSDMFNCADYPLSTTWRCSRAVIDEASTIVGDFLQARPDADTGGVQNMTEDQLLNSSLDQNSMVVCRMNAPLIGLALKLLKRRVSFKLMSDFPNRLLKKVKRLAEGTSGIAGFKTALREHYEEKIEQAGDNKGLKARIIDEKDTLLSIANDCHDVGDVIRTLEDLTQAQYGIVLATGHKSKGLEADNVFILRPDLCPAPWVDQDAAPEAYQQEQNLLYVMITRAKHNLIYVHKE